jgi:hypothetical protein
MSADLGAYSLQRKGFPVTMKSPVQLETNRFLVLDGSPSVVRTTEASSDERVRDCSYHFVGGQARTWFVPVPTSEADAFANDNGDSLTVDLAFFVTSAKFDEEGEPSFVFTGPVDGPGADALRGQKTGPGDALGVRVIGWAIKSNHGDVLIRQDPKPST